MWRKVVLAAAAVTCAGCVASYKITPSKSLGVKRGLSPGASLLVGVSPDGSFEAKHYAASGETTTREVVRAMSRCAMKIDALQEPTSLEDGVAQARARRFTHYIHPTILHWEDRATEWSGKRDKISIRLQVVEVESNNIIDAATLDGKSKLVTFGGDHPQELLAKPLAQYADRLCP